MRRYRSHMTTLKGCAIAVTAVWLAVLVASAQGPAPLERLTDAEFWTLMTDASELGGSFHSSNFTSNEAYFPTVAATLAKSGPHGGAYLGVGPEQNFHYIAAIRPAIAVVFDIRRQAVMQHLLYKALFELSADRTEFIARLFSFKRPDGVDRKASIDDIWKAFGSAVAVDRARFVASTIEVEKLLGQTHGFKLSSEDLIALETVYEAFFTFGPAIDYSGGVKGLTTGNINFMKISTAVDGAGVARSFLATDEHFQFLKSMHARNLIVPIQADFGGPKAMRAVGDFLRARGLRVSAFYISNVEQYLFNPRSPTAPNGQETNGGWRAFYDNLATLPADKSSVLLRVPFSATAGALMVRRTLPDGTITTERRETVPLCGLVEFLAAVNAGKVTTQSQANACGR